MIKIAMTPAQFAAAKAVLETNPEVISHSESGQWSGNFATAQVGMSYSYDGSELSLVITARHGFEAKIASENQIKDRLVTLLGELHTS